MPIENVAADAVGHAGLGAALSFLDFLTYKLANPKATRLEQKRACLQAIEILLDTEQSQETDISEKNQLEKDSTRYAEQIAVVRDYLRRSGIVKLQLPLPDRVKDGLRNLLLHEKINVLSNMQKLAIAGALEVLYDILLDFRYNAVTGIAASLYQIPAFFAGLWIGNIFKNVINFLITPGDEKKLDTTIQQLMEETAVVDIVVNYVPSEKVKGELAERGVEVYMSQLTRAGKKAYRRLQQIAETAKSAADDVIHFAQKQEEKQEQEREERKKRFDDLTKGR